MESLGSVECGLVFTGLCETSGLYDPSKRVHLRVSTQRLQYPLMKDYTLNCRGLNIMIQGILLN